MKNEEILELLHTTEALKKELRHSWLSDGRQESVAEHSWRLCFMVVLMAPKLKEKIDINRALKIAVIHDLSEVFVGDMPAFNNNRENHKILEEQAMKKMKDKYKTGAIDEIYDLWQEYELTETMEAKFVKALDKIEVRLQHNEAKMETWSDIEYPRSMYAADKHCEYDEFLKEFNETIKEEAKNKIKKESDKNIDEILKQAEELKKN